MKIKGRIIFAFILFILSGCSPAHDSAQGSDQEIVIGQQTWAARNLAQEIPGCKIEDGRYYYSFGCIPEIERQNPGWKVPAWEDWGALFEHLNGQPQEIRLANWEGGDSVKDALAIDDFPGMIALQSNKDTTWASYLVRDSAITVDGQIMAYMMTFFKTGRNIDKGYRAVTLHDAYLSVRLLRKKE